MALEGLTALTALDLTACLSVDDEALTVLSRSFTQLRRLKLEECNVTNDGILQLRALRDLKSLNLPFASKAHHHALSMYYDRDAARHAVEDDAYPISRAGVARLQEHLKGCDIQGITPFSDSDY